jgi:hypothetical protein
MGSKRFTWIMLTEAAKHASKVVRNPAEWPRSLRFRPIKVPAMTVSASRNARPKRSSSPEIG